MTCVGTFIVRRSVEFWPGTVGSGEKLMEVSLNSEAPFEQSVTVERVVVANDRRVSAAKANIF
jgi:hypothetical protein